MTIDAMIMLAGGLVALLPIMEGLPVDWQRPILFVLGIFIVGLGIIVRRRGLGNAPVERSTFVDAPVTRQTPEPDVE